MSRRYLHAPDDAPLYRVPEALGGKAFPAYRVYANSNGKVVAVLDIEGELFTFDQDQLTPITRPEGLPDWAIAVILHVIRIEEVHGSLPLGANCFCEVLDAIPAEARAYLDTLREARQSGGAVVARSHDHACGKEICAGSCPAAGKVVAVKDRHNAQHCHGGHLEHVKVFAGKVLATFAPAARKPWTVGTVAVPGPMGGIPADIQAQIDIALAERKAQGLKPDASPRMPRVGQAVGTIALKHFLPLDGEESVLSSPLTDSGPWRVTCNAIRCRDEYERTNVLGEFPNARMADLEAERHRAWHVEQRTGVAPRLREGLMLTPADMREGDWYHSSGQWQRIALISPMSNQVRLHDETWRTSLGLIATLEHKGEYLIVRSANRPTWTPVYDARKRMWVEP